MSTKETHVYTDTCDLCELTAKREWGSRDKPVVQEFYYGLLEPVRSDSSSRNPKVEKSVHACSLCRDKLSTAIDAVINP